MSISIDPSAFHTQKYNNALDRMSQRIEKPLDANIREQIKQNPTEVKIEGTVYESKHVNFRALNHNELINESIDITLPKQSFTTHSDGSRSEKSQIVIIRDPNNPTSHVAFELSKESLERLHEKFKGKDNFYERAEGVVRLNGEVERFVAGWLDDINENRNYAKADADGNGLIQGDEAKDLNIAYEPFVNYDYLGRKPTYIEMGTDATYQSLGRSPGAHHLFDENADASESILFSQYIDFEKSASAELEHTLQIDADLDGTVSYEEALKSKFGENYREQIVSAIKTSHDDYLNDHSEFDNEKQLRQRNLGKYEIISKEEERMILKQFAAQQAQLELLQREQQAQVAYNTLEKKI